ncbi:MAG: TIGR03905 family TSCPD domain-containing protein [Oscillospiraceae bacterium]|nr:TIGR03905 family TSCPD domain-containing protein [Oscillospiraceae bacterium]
MRFEYSPKGVCSRKMIFEVEDGIVRSLTVEGGCNGNLQGISSLLIGLSVDDVIKRLEGIKCGMKPTSCPDQIAQALKTLKSESAE